MRDFQKKNISPVITDIRHPKKGSSNDSKKSNWVVSFLKKLFITVIILAIGGSAIFFVVNNLKKEFTDFSTSLYQSLKDVESGFSKFENKSVSDSLEGIDGQVKDFNNRFSFLEAIPILKQVPDTFAKIQELTNTLKDVNDNFVKLVVYGPTMIFGEEGVLTTLNNLHADLGKLSDLTNNLRNTASKFNDLSQNFNSEYLSLDTNLSRSKEALEAVINLIGSDSEKHILVLFENPSEIRPAGGFVGSYADLSLSLGKIKAIDVNDIYYPDKFLKLKVVPPIQLQSLTVDWGARDANWFFDFPTSAKKVAYFAENSPVFKDKSIIFEGVVSINVRVIEDILKITGPVKLDEYKLTLDQNNFLREVQYEVEAGRDKIPGQNPKKILSKITPILIEKIKSLDESQRKSLLEAFTRRLQNKDIKLYFKDTKLENLVSELGFSGEIFDLPSRFNGDYLAVVDTNVAGGKTDEVIKQSINLTSAISTDGTINDNLVVKRTHSGNKEKLSFYKVTNQNFIKIFTPPDSYLEVITGSTPKKITPRLNYVKAGYIVDDDLKSIEDTREILDKYGAESYKEFGKKVYAAWFNISSGKSKEINFVYSQGSKISISDGLKYQFVFDKQSGVDSSLDYSLQAPQGYFFEETNSPIFHYEKSDLPARLVIDLTFKKAGE